MRKKYNLYGIGNALVDMEFEVTDEFYQTNRIDKGLMTLVDQDRQNELMLALGDQPKKRQCGGSAANSMIANAQLGGKGFYSCKVASDTTGTFYFEDLLENGVDSNLQTHSREEGITGKCLVMVTPDAERTMNTFLGITSTLSKAEIDAEALKNSDFYYMEGYLVASPTGKAAAIEGRNIAEAHGVRTALTFSDVNMVKYFKDGLKEMIGNKIDLVFCNAAEALAFTDTSDLIEAREKLKAFSRTFVITLGENGAMIFDGDTFVDIEPYKVKAVDSNGAGDMFAGSFLYGITHGHSMASSGKLASLAASKIVSQFGPRLSTVDVLKIKSQVFGA